MHFDEMANNCQAEAQASESSGRCAVGLTESVEDMRQELGFNPYTVVADGDFDLISGAAQTHFDTPAFVRELDGIRQQVPDDLLQTIGVAENSLSSPSITTCRSIFFASALGRMTSTAA